MKKIILIALFFLSISVNAQNLLTQNFDNTETISNQGWIITEQSTPTPALTNWFQGDPEPFASHQGNSNSYIAADAKSISQGDISSWLVSPTVNLQNGDIISFYTRDVDNETADRLELRISTSGASSVIPSGGYTSLGSFTLLALSVNPNLTLTGYPSTWNQYTYTVTGLTGLVNCKIGFRYFVTGVAPQLLNGGYIGLDTVNINRTILSNNEFENKLFTISPNPSQNVLNFRTTEDIKEVNIYDMLGKKVMFNMLSINSLDVSSLSKGMYVIKIMDEDDKLFSSKFIKE